jgi:hypothetical protein
MARIQAKQTSISNAGSDSVEPLEPYRALIPLAEDANLLRASQLIELLELSRQET